VLWHFGRSVASHHFSSSICQYASLMNIDRPSIRISWTAYSRFRVGWTGSFPNRSAAWRDVRSTFRVMHVKRVV
jgi:hypothetical protein